MSEVVTDLIVIGCYGLSTTTASSKIGILKYDDGTLFGLGESLDFHTFSVASMHSKCLGLTYKVESNAVKVKMLVREIDPNTPTSFTDYYAEISGGSVVTTWATATVTLNKISLTPTAGGSVVLNCFANSGDTLFIGGRYKATGGTYFFDMIDLNG